MYMCIYSYVYLYLYIYIHVYIYTYICIFMYTHEERQVKFYKFLQLTWQFKLSTYPSVENKNLQWVR